jgi:RNA polymerase sigma-70 factor (ECF subfamily)
MSAPVCYGAEVPSVKPEQREAPVLAVQALIHVDALYAFACYLSHDRTLAEDLVQETFTRCLSATPRALPDAQLKAWLFRILRNLFLDSRRREARSPIRAVAEVPAVGAQAAVAGVMSNGELQDGPRRLVANDIEMALRALSEEQRSVVLLDLEGLSEAEIAEVMDCAPGTVKSRLARARAALRVELAEYGR